MRVTLKFKDGRKKKISIATSELHPHLSYFEPKSLPGIHALEALDELLSNNIRRFKLRTKTHKVRNWRQRIKEIYGKRNDPHRFGRHYIHDVAYQMEKTWHIYEEV